MDIIKTNAGGQKKMNEAINEYYDTRKQLDKASIDYLNTRREYQDKEFEILTTFDFKSEYGKDNDKIRNGHIRNELSDLLLKRDALELEVEQLKRYLRYLELVIEYSG